MQEEVTESKIALQNANERADVERKAREQAETISLMLSEQVEQLKKQVSNLTAKMEQNDKIFEELKNLKTEYSELQKALADEQSSKEKDLVIAEKGKETAIKVAIAETKEQYLAKIEKLQQEHSRQLNLLISQKQQY